METMSFHAPDIECDGCANAIKKSVGKVAGVANVDVDVERKTVTVHSDAPREQVVAALERAGFPPADA